MKIIFKAIGWGITSTVAAALLSHFVFHVQPGYVTLFLFCGLGYYLGGSEN